MLNPSRTDTWLNTAGAWTLAMLWLLPLLYAVWSAFHATEFSASLLTTSMAGRLVRLTG